MSKPQRATAKAGAADLRGRRDRLHEPRGGPHAYAALLGLEATGTLELLARIEAGLPYRAALRFRRSVGLTLHELGALVQITPRTLARRREEGRLTPEESDRLLRAARVFGKALELCEGDLEAARTWLATPAPALGGRTPREVAATEVGAREVEDLAGRLEHGIFP